MEWPSALTSRNIFLMSFWTQLLISSDTKKYKVNFGNSKSQKGGFSSFKPVALKLDPHIICHKEGISKHNIGENENTNLGFITVSKQRLM